MGLLSGSIFSSIKNKGEAQVNFNTKLQDANINNEQTYNTIDYASKIENAIDKYFDLRATIELSVAFGVLEVVENIGDALLLASGSILSWGSSILGNEELAQEYKDTTMEMISYDWTEAGYDLATELLGVSDDIAQGTVHNVASGIGTTVGYVALSLVPGGAAVTATTGALAAAGSAAERAANSGATFEEVQMVSAVSGIAGAISGGALNKLQGLAAGTKTVGAAIGYTLAGSATAAAEPLLNTTAEYLTYGKETGASFATYFKESGGLTNLAMAAIIGGASVGSASAISLVNSKKTALEELTEIKAAETEASKIQNATSDKSIIDTSKLDYGDYTPEAVALANASGVDIEIAQLRSDGKIQSEELWNILCNNKDFSVEDALRELQKDPKFIKGIEIQSDGTIKTKYKYPPCNGADGVTENYVGDSITDLLINLGLKKDGIEITTPEQLSGLKISEINKLLKDNNVTGIEYVSYCVEEGRYCLGLKVSEDQLTSITQNGFSVSQVQEGELLTRVGDFDGKYIGDGANSKSSISIPMEDQTDLYVGEFTNSTGQKVYSWQEKIAPAFGENGGGTQKFIMTPDESGSYLFRTRAVDKYAENIDLSTVSFTNLQWTPEGSSLATLTEKKLWTPLTEPISLKMVDHFATFSSLLK